MALPGMTYSQVDFSSGQLSAKAGRRDDVKLQRSGLKTGANIRILPTGAAAQRFGRSAYNTGTGRTEIVRLSDTETYEFLFGDGTLSIYDDDETLLNTFSSLPWSLATLDEIGISVAEREVYLTFRNTRPKRLALGTSGTLPAEFPTSDMLDNLAYPTQGSHSSGKYTSSATTTHATSLPSGIQPGDLLILYFRTATEDSVATTPTGWTLLDSYDSETAEGTSSIWYKTATGADDAPVVETDLGGRSAWVINRIVDWSDIEGAFETSDTLNPPSLSPSWGSNRNYWNILCSWRGDRNLTPATPSDYDTISAPNTVGGATSAQVGLKIAEDDEETGTEDPGTFTEQGAFGDQFDFHAATVAVKPDETAETNKAFDGDNDKPAATCITKASDDEAIIYIDRSADPTAVASVTVRGSNDAGFVAGATPDVTITLYGKNGSVPTIASPGDSLGDDTAADTADESGGRSITSSDTSTEYDYLAVVITHDGSDADMYVAQVTFLSPAPANDSWAIASFAFDTNDDGVKRQPYTRYAPLGITMTPAARTGSGIAVTFSDAALDASHVGTSFRFHGRECVIASVTDAVSGKVDIVEDFPPTRRVACTDANGRDQFSVGQVVIGQTSNAEGLIVAFNSTANLDVVMLKGDNFVDTERIVSATGNTAVSGTPSSETPAASPVWDEALMSDFRGWPASVNYDRSRLIFCDFPTRPKLIAWSAVGLPRDFLPGTDADAAILESASDGGRVYFVAGGADQYVITDTNVMYIPISSANPLAPGSVEFRPIAAVGAAQVKPALMHEGVVYVAEGGRALIAIVPTGQTSFPYRTAAISEFHSDLFSNVIALTAMTGGGGEAEQYLWVLKSDGTAVVGRFDPSNEWAGFVPVTGDGTIKWITSLAGDVKFNVKYQSGDSDPPWAMEELDPDVFLDGAVPYNSGAPSLRPTPDAGEGRLWMYAGLTVELMNGDAYLGSRVIDENGDITDETGDDWDAYPNLIAGFAYTVTIVPWIPAPPEGDERGQRMRRRRVKRAAATVRDTTKFTLMGKDFGSSSTAADNTWRAAGNNGREWDPTITLSKAEPGPLTLLELAADVSV